MAKDKDNPTVEAQVDTAKKTEAKAQVPKEQPLVVEGYSHINRAFRKQFKNK